MRVLAIVEASVRLTVCLPVRPFVTQVDQWIRQTWITKSSQCTF